MELLAGNSTLHLLQRFGPLTETILRKITRHLLHAISFVHREGIFHRDIKPANILVSHTGNVKLCDFGCSKKVSELSKATSCIIGTPIYMAPELIKGSPHQKSDIWSVGCTLFELATGLLPWYHSRVKDNLPLMFYITTTSETPVVLQDNSVELSLEFQSFLNLCFVRDVQKRPDAIDLLQHPWITERKPPMCHTNSFDFGGTNLYPLKNDVKRSNPTPDGSHDEDEMENEDEEPRSDTETICQQELEDVCATIALDRCHQLMNYHYPVGFDPKSPEDISEANHTSFSTPSPSVGKPTDDFYDGSIEKSILHDDFVFQQAPLGTSVGNFVLPSDGNDAQKQQFLRLHEDGKLSFATLPEEEPESPELTNFRSPSADSSVFFHRSHNSRMPSLGRKDSQSNLHVSTSGNDMHSLHGNFLTSRDSSPRCTSPAEGSSQEPGPDDSKLYTSFTVNAASGHAVNVELEVDRNDVHMRIVNNHPNYLVSFNDNIKSQITNKLKEVAAQAEVDNSDTSRGSNKRYKGVGSDHSHRQQSPKSAGRSSQNVSFHSSDPRSRENTFSDNEGPTRSSASPQRKVSPGFLSQRPTQSRSLRG